MCIRDSTSTSNRGGGINFDTGTLNILRSTIDNNKGSTLTTNSPGGGGIYVDNQENNPTLSLNVTSSTISGNDSDGNRNGGVFQIRGQLTITNSTILGGVEVNSSSTTTNVKSSILSHVSGFSPTSNLSLIHI